MSSQEDFGCPVSVTLESSLISWILILFFPSQDNGKCLGKLNSKTGTYDWLTFEQTLDRIRHFGSGLVHLGLKAGSSSRIGIYATNCVDYVIAEYGAYNHSMVVVPLYDTLGPNAVTFILNEADIEVVICDTEDRLRALTIESGHFKKLKHVILVCDVIESFKSKAIGCGLKVYTVKEIEDLGKQNASNYTVSPSQVRTKHLLLTVCLSNRNLVLKTWL